MTRIAYLFPGQGSQFVGMGRGLAEQYAQARALFEEADAVLGFALGKLCWEGPEDVLTDTLNAQPALLVASVAALRVLESRVPQAPDYVAGHSMGEFSALVAAGALDFADALRLVRERGRLMKAAGEYAPGGMVAVLGAERAALDALCAEAAAATGEVVQVANDNCPGQIVISGARAALEKAQELAKARGIKRLRPLPVSIASHCPLMRQAAEEFRAVVAATPMRAPRVPVIGNVSAAPLTGVDAIREELGAQLTSSVRWTESVRAMIAGSAGLFVELGPKDVLTGLLKRIDESARGIAAGEPAGIDAATEALRVP